MKKGKMTPLMEQYWGVKADHPDKVLLFRMGDFFEMFHEDAVIAAPILNIALTQRNKKSQDDTPMCGVPHHSISGPIAKLLDAGHKVAICDQVEDPKEAKGLVKRAVTRILSPGMVYDPETLNQLEANYLCSYDEESVSFLETSTGEAFYYKVSQACDRKKIMTILQPAEVVLSSEQKNKELKNLGLEGAHITAYDLAVNHEFPERFQNLPESASRLLAYGTYMQGPELYKSLQNFERRTLEKRLEVSPTVLRHLEVFETYKGEQKGSLFTAINRTKTSAGARMFRQWLQFPLANEEELLKRQARVAEWMNQPGKLKDVREVLSQLGDIERRLGKLTSPTSHVRDVVSLKQSLSIGLALSPFCPEAEKDSLKLASSLVEEVERTFVDELPTKIKNGGFVRRGYNPTLDEYIQLTDESQKLLAELEEREKSQTGIPSLKIRYNNVFGYYIEVTKTHTDKVPDHYKRKQTLTNAERYLTQELQELEDKILSARSKRIELEEEIFRKLRQKIVTSAVDLLSLARNWSELDILSSFAWLAIEQKYCRPQFRDDHRLHLKASRHPVVEQEMNVAFVPNSILLDQGECLLLTGPNMAGKSTLMRQVAIISLMAQVGSYVPAEAAEVPLFDRVFTRIGASDHLAEGLSTFMVEMTEAAEMLKSATDKSLVVLDEVGRGTSTYDGMSLAQAILEFLIKKCKPITLFATHYHELTSMEQTHSQIKNAHMSIQEESGHIRFLHSLKPGPANKSYGIQVARLAGLPFEVTKRAKAFLERHESFGAQGSTSGQMTLMDVAQSEEAQYPEWVEELMELSVQQLTPLDALNKIAKWQQKHS